MVSEDGCGKGVDFEILRLCTLFFMNIHVLASRYHGICRISNVETMECTSLTIYLIDHSIESL